MKRIALAALAVWLLVPQAYGAPWIKSLATAQKKAKDAKQLIFVDLFAQWCGWCHKMEQEVFPSEVFQKATDDMVLLRLDTEDGKEGTQLAQRYNVSTLPTFLVLTGDGMVAGIIRGYAPANEFVKSVKAVEKTFGEFQKRAQQEGSIASDYQKRLDLAREFTAHYGLTQSESRLKKLVGEAKVPVPIRDQAYYELAVSQALQNRFDEATKTIASFAKVQTKGEPFERARLMQAQIYTQQGNIKEAVAELRSFKTKFPNSALLPNVEMMLPQLERRLSAPQVR